MHMKPHQRFANWLRYRHTLYVLGGFDDHLLADMGLSRDTLAERIKQADRQARC